jgi:hypothetical protein
MILYSHCLNFNISAARFSKASQYTTILASLKQTNEVSKTLTLQYIILISHPVVLFLNNNLVLPFEDSPFAQLKPLLILVSIWDKNLDIIVSI